MPRKKKTVDMIPQLNSGLGLGDRLSTDISPAENGFVVHVSGETGGKKKPAYFSKRYIAHTRPEAMRIAVTHFAKANGKKGERKKLSVKV